MHILITAGPTREYFDPVRFLSNGATGKMGYACAEAARKRGHKVTLISGPVGLTKLQGVKFIPVVSSAEMAQAVKKHYAGCDCVIMTAAVCDYRPRERQAYKMQKNQGTLQLELERTEDILAYLGQCKQHQILIGFAVQDRAGRSNARRKMRAKNLDAIVLNGPAAFGAERVDVEILRRGGRGGRWESYPAVAKKRLARTIVQLAEKTKVLNFVNSAGTVGL